jgi:3alpha(or 20beta)-hydroxysteroid dehydrogenase
MAQLAQLQDKVAIITGGARGQGEAEARLFVERGAKVVITDLSVEDGEKVAASLGDAARFMKHDVSSAADWQAVVDFTVAEFGTVDILVNNAAIYRVMPFANETIEDLEKIYKVNVHSVFLGMQTVLPVMKAKRSGSIVNISSQSGLEGLPAHAAYGSSKWAVRGLGKTAALEAGEYGVRINTVLPGVILTPMIAMHGIEAGEGKMDNIPLRRAAEPAEVATAVAFLASDDASYVTGTELIVDGGMMAGITPPAGAF